MIEEGRRTQLAEPRPEKKEGRHQPPARTRRHHPMSTSCTDYTPPSPDGLRAFGECWYTFGAYGADCPDMVPGASYAYADPDYTAFCSTTLASLQSQATAELCPYDIPSSFTGASTVADMCGLTCAAQTNDGILGAGCTPLPPPPMPSPPPPSPSPPIPSPPRPAPSPPPPSPSPPIPSPPNPSPPSPSPSPPPPKPPPSPPSMPPQPCSDVLVEDSATNPPVEGCANLVAGKDTPPSQTCASQAQILIDNSVLLSAGVGGASVWAPPTPYTNNSFVFEFCGATCSAYGVFGGGCTPNAPPMAPDEPPDAPAPIPPAIPPRMPPPAEPVHTHFFPSFSFATASFISFSPICSHSTLLLLSALTQSVVT